LAAADEDARANWPAACRASARANNGRAANATRLAKSAVRAFNSSGVMLGGIARDGPDFIEDRRSKIEDGWTIWISEHREIETSDAPIFDSSDLRSIFDLPSSIFDVRNFGPATRQ